MLTDDASVQIYLFALVTVTDVIHCKLLALLDSSICSKPIII